MSTSVRTRQQQTRAGLAGRGAGNFPLNPLGDLYRNRRELVARALSMGSAGSYCTVSGAA
jgi:hypothetical protein